MFARQISFFKSKFWNLRIKLEMLKPEKLKPEMPKPEKPKPENVSLISSPITSPITSPFTSPVWATISGFSRPKPET